MKTYRKPNEQLFSIIGGHPIKPHFYIVNTNFRVFIQKEIVGTRRGDPNVYSRSIL